MTQIFKVAAYALNQQPGDWTGNEKRIISAVIDAKKNGIQLAVLPELCISGYSLEDAVFRREVQERALSSLMRIAPFARNVAVIVGLPYRHDAIYNCAAFLAEGEVQGLYAKQNLANDGIHYEQRQYKAWPVGEVSFVNLPNHKSPVPLGDILFSYGSVRIGIEICEDSWVINRPAANTGAAGIDILATINASHFALGKADTRRKLATDASQKFQTTVVAAYNLGNEAGGVIFDGGNLIASCGQLLTENARLTFDDISAISCEIDLEPSRLLRHSAHQHVCNSAHAVSFEAPNRKPLVVFLKPAISENLTGGSENLTGTTAIVAHHTQPALWSSRDNQDFHEYLRACCLGMFDYLRRSRSFGYTLSLSGGADSSTVCTLVHDFLQLAAHEKSFSGLKKILSYIPGVDSVQTVRELCGLLLHCVYQKTENSSEKTLNSARSLAEEVGARFSVLEIDEAVKTAREQAESYLGRKFTWEKDSLTLQNIQARVRGLNAWTLANGANHLLVPPSNMSETAVGYFTQGGDDSGGGPNPLGGARKSFLLRYLLWREHLDYVPLAPLGSLKLVNSMSPTAELMPTAAGQTDEGELGPYIVRDFMQQRFIRDQKSAVEVLEDAILEFSADYSAEQLGAWLESFIRLFARNQWKRERLAVSFHIDDHNLNPRSWLRWPILYAGQEAELSALREACGKNSLKN